MQTGSLGCSSDTIDMHAYHLTGTHVPWLASPAYTAPSRGVSIKTHMHRTHVPIAIHTDMAGLTMLTHVGTNIHTCWLAHGMHTHLDAPVLSASSTI